MEFIPFDLIGKKDIDEVVNIGNGSGKDSQKMTARVKVRNATAGGGGDLGPGVD